MRKVLNKKRLKGRWKCRNECQEMPQEVVYAVIDCAPGEGRRGALGETSFKSLQARFYNNFPRAEHHK